MLEPRARITIPLGGAQTLAWASSYYLPAVLGAPIASELGLHPSAVFAAFSFALVISALTAPWSGRAIDQRGGRPVLLASSVLFAVGLGLMAKAEGPIGLFTAWAFMGLAMGSGLYDAAFACLVRLHGPKARPSITGVTLMAGFASTVGWPLSAALLEHVGWRGACATWAVAGTLRWGRHSWRAWLGCTRYAQAGAGRQWKTCATRRCGERQRARAGFVGPCEMLFGPGAR
jgi:MFS family permease